MPNKITDKMRLDWLRDNPAWLAYQSSGEWGIGMRRDTQWQVIYGNGPRQAIDAAIRAERKEKGR